MRNPILATTAWLCLAVPCFAQDDVYLLDAGDEVRLTVAEHPELSGNFAINSEGAIGLPILDGLRIAGKNIEVAKSAIFDKIGSRVQHVSLSFEITRHRPFFILGDVQRPGSYPWPPGLTAEIAVALASGYRSQSEYFAAAVTGVRAAESRADAARGYVDAWVERARLRAELADASTFEYADEQVLPGSAERVREAAERQKELFEARKEVLTERLQLLKKQLSIQDNEISALEARYDAQQREEAQLKNEQRSVQDYVQRGLTPVSRLNSLNREEIRLQGDLLQNSALINQSRLARNQTELQLSSLTRDRRVEILTSIKETSARIVRLNRQMLADEAVMAEANSTPNAEEATVTFKVRSKSDGAVYSTTNESTLIKPGDVVTVRSSWREGGRGSAEQNPQHRSAER